MLFINLEYILCVNNSYLIYAMIILIKNINWSTFICILNLESVDHNVLKMNFTKLVV